ncbi:MAG: helix-turn-helix domain-containing protein [Nitrososphaerota archaeon]|uniref:helix-turn-helix domain-containing protein n=1 Tax=Candidatus Bathycorpusculum sp. TaxID=2994959 RepID=UPI002817447A|nr:helix-turn-helix domain-containing protein [Candidatus Termiticorpusculum sp.]MCL2257537.1 helix-turn-helix domain-containing protein [Candidatus Termiticorpusculum sp.]MCL2292121.1 helix-turn-helix domain-containing protein [Candidatus Termiticorpusculum sp.]MDR0461171.1 helix-turn-helix domain-containing protein [Nitrososphaerota archaeon]
MSREEGFGKKPLIILEKIKTNLEALNNKLDIIIDIQKSGYKDAKVHETSLDVMTLLNMPDHLRKTAIIICRNSRATAEEIAEQTNRARAVESSYLNQLVTMGYIKKMRKGRKAYFYVDRERVEDNYG